MNRKVIIAGGGAAGFFGAIACAERNPELEVILMERGAHFLAKVRVSGGGRCNITHACFDPRELSRRYPRGGRALLPAFHRFQPRDTIAWFEGRGVKLKTEADGRMFPVSDSSQTIIDCLHTAAEKAGVLLESGCGLESVRKKEAGFEVTTTTGEIRNCDVLLLATGGCRAGTALALVQSLGHQVEPPVPSLFTFHVEKPWLRELPGLSVEDVEVSVPHTDLKERGPLLITHWGLSGPSVLRISAWGARLLHGMDYRFPLRIRWVPAMNIEEITAALQALRQEHPNRRVVNSSFHPLPTRLWVQLVMSAGISAETCWNQLTRTATQTLVGLLHATELPVTGKSMNKEEFVTCGGVRLNEVDFKTMQSRICPHLHFAGELLDLDGITGGYNFQAAWTTGWIAGQAIAKGENIS